MHNNNAAQVIEHLDKMRQLKEAKVTPEEALPLCDQAMEIYGPMAEELGMRVEQHKMLDLAVELGYPEDYKHLKKLLFESEVMCENVFNTFAMPLRSMLDSLGIEYTFNYRMKSVYSIWRKMRVDHKEFDDVYDLFATRIVYKTPDAVESLNGAIPMEAREDIADTMTTTLSNIDRERLLCWRIYTVISALYRIHPDRIKDWVTHPKPSGYQALQLTVMGPDCNWIEIQIRSERMHFDAEHGIASHALYKKETAVK